MENKDRKGTCAICGSYEGHLIKLPNEDVYGTGVKNDFVCDKCMREFKIG